MDTGYVANVIISQNSRITEILITSKKFGDKNLKFSTNRYENVRNDHWYINKSGKKLVIRSINENKKEYKTFWRVLFQEFRHNVQINFLDGDEFNYCDDNIEFVSISHKALNIKKPNKNSKTGHRGISISSYDPSKYRIQLTIKGQHFRSHAKTLRKAKQKRQELLEKYEEEIKKIGALCK